MSYKLSGRKIKGVTIYNKNDHLDIQWLAVFDSINYCRHSHIMLGDKQVIKTPLEVHPCDVCINQVECSMSNESIAGIYLHSNHDNIFIKELKPLIQMKDTEGLVKNLAFISCNFFVPAKKQWLEVLDKYGFHLF